MSLLAQQQQQSLSHGVSLPEAAFLKGQQQQQLPVAGIEKRIASFFSEISEGTFRPRETHILDSVRPSGPWCFPVRRAVSLWAQQQQQQSLSPSSSMVPEAAFLKGQLHQQQQQQLPVAQHIEKRIASFF